MKKEIIIGILLVVLGIGLFAYYDIYIKPERKANALLVEAKISFEQGTRYTVNNSINIFSKIVANYPKSKAAFEAYYYIAQGYEKLGLNRLAFLKYNYILKTDKNISNPMNNEVRTRLARLKIMKYRTEEGVNQLLGLLNYSTDKDFRSRVYSELGHSYLKRRLYKKSKRMFDISLAENGNNEEAILGKARAYKHMGYSNSAYDLYEYFLKYYGYFSNYSNDIRQSYRNQVYSSGYNSFKRGSYYNAISYFKRMIRYFPNSYKSENALYWIGESYFGLKKYNTALHYFNRVLSNSHSHKNQDARMKKGYSYFMSKRFDLAAREFQKYLDYYPRGRFVTTAKKWKKMSTKEILYRIKNKPEVELQDDDDFEAVDDDKIDTEDSAISDKESKSKTKDIQINYKNRNSNLENVAEI